MKSYIKYKRIEIIAYSTSAIFLIVATFFSNSYGRNSSDAISHSMTNNTIFYPLTHNNNNIKHWDVEKKWSRIDFSLNIYDFIS